MESGGRKHEAKGIKSDWKCGLELCQPKKDLSGLMIKKVAILPRSG